MISIYVAWNELTPWCHERVWPASLFTQLDVFVVLTTLIAYLVVNIVVAASAAVDVVSFSCNNNNNSGTMLFKEFYSSDVS